ncbi:MAG: SH3 domain-containing protein [Lachnospiraceae bacterium]|nr:SH3 domain-containing protein [Lachnospiraceae bacterium]
MKKVLPAMIAIVLILAIIGISVGRELVEKYSYSKERANLEEYFSLESEDEVAVVLHNERIEKSARLWDGVYYFDLDTIHEYLNDRFYADEREGLLLYTLPDYTVRSAIGTTAYLTEEGTKDAGYIIARYGLSSEGSEEVLYVAADYVKKFTNFSYQPFTEPNRMQVSVDSQQQLEAGQKKAILKKDTAVRYQGGVKSPILTDVKQGEQVLVLEEMENWSKIKTADVFIGYVENKRLEVSSTGAVVVEEDKTEGETEQGELVGQEYTSIQRPYQINLAWHVVGGQVGGEVLAEALAGTQGINVISPTWFALTDSEGNFSSLATEGYVKKAHDMGLEVWALIDNFTNKSQVDNDELLSHTSRREKLIGNLMNVAAEYDLDGINVDFEGLAQEVGPHFVQFIRELSVECRKQEIVLSVDNYVPTGYTDHYGRREQGIFADYVIIMGYDEHYNGSPQAGSVASIGFVEEGIQRTVEEVPSQKVINALPFYTRIWKTSGAKLSSEAVGMEVAEQFVKNHNMPLRWDEDTCQNYGEITEGDTVYQVWLEDEQSIEVKLNIMKKYNLGGVAAWRLGFEKPVIWEVIGSYLSGEAAS